VHHFLRWAHGCPASYKFYTLHSLIVVRHTIHASLFIFVCIPILFSLSIDLGRLLDRYPTGIKKKSPCLSSVVADRFVVHGGHRMSCLSCFVASSFYVSHCILISIARLVDFSMEPYCRYMTNRCMHYHWDQFDGPRPQRS
jgi:hypothetical protein